MTNPTNPPIRALSKFFRNGKSGAGRHVLPAAEFTAYQAKVATMAPSGALTWLHRW
jgi:hypothetical protein